MSISVPILIPSYEPDERLLDLLKTIELDKNFIIIVDDGSGDKYQPIFDEVESFLGEYGCVLHHEVNKGKGRALKTGFSYILDNMPDAIGVVTADSDGQHVISAISDVAAALTAEPNKLIMGVRSFGGEDIPWKSRFGNNLTVKVTAFITGVKTTDTQTGLRGISRKFMEELLDVKGERFEFEMEMLVESAGKYPIKEIEIPTIYDSKENHQTHFRPFVDSMKIYKVFGKKIGKFLLSSLSSCVIDITLFWLFRNFVFPDKLIFATVSVVAARIISATYNYLINYLLVFKSKEKMSKAAVKYAILALIQMSLSAGLTTLGVWAISFMPDTVIKIIVDVILFLISYKIQQKIVF